MPSFLELSDEDFMKATPPEVTQVEQPTPEVVEQPDPVVETPVVETAATEVETPETVEAPAAEPVASPAVEAPAVEQPTAEAPTPPVEKPEKEEKKPEPTAATPAAEIDYKAGYEQIMAPFKANGKTIELRSPDEAIKLMQMGANYTKNMQMLAPHRKLLVMLEKAGINESNVGLLIDAHNKNPQAIAKMVKDAGVDPMDIDVSKEPQYVASQHNVSDAEVAWRQSIEELQGSDEGQATLVHVNQHWDNGSKQLLAENPGLLQSIHAQRVSGIYDRIDTEIQRLRTLGNIPAGIPYLQAYKTVGEYLQSNGGFDDLVQKPVQTAAQPAIKLPVATTVKKAEPQVKPGADVGTASISRTAPVVAKQASNFLAMSDDDFLKQFQNLQ